MLYGPRSDRPSLLASARRAAERGDLGPLLALSQQPRYSTAARRDLSRRLLARLPLSSFSEVLGLSAEIDADSEARILERPLALAIARDDINPSPLAAAAKQLGPRGLACLEMITGQWRGDNIWLGRLLQYSDSSAAQKRLSQLLVAELAYASFSQHHLPWLDRWTELVLAELERLGLAQPARMASDDQGVFHLLLGDGLGACSASVTGPSCDVKYPELCQTCRHHHYNGLTLAPSAGWLEVIGQPLADYLEVEIAKQLRQCRDDKGSLCWQHLQQDCDARVINFFYDRLSPALASLGRRAGGLVFGSGGHELDQAQWRSFLAQRPNSS